MTVFSKILLCLSSWLPVGIYQFYSTFTSKDINNFEINLSSRIFCWCIGIYIVLCLLVIKIIKNLKADRRIYNRINDEITFENFLGIISLLTPFLTPSDNGFSYPVFCFVFLTWCVVSCFHSYVRFCPIFFFSGYRLHKTSDNNYVFLKFKVSKDQFNVLQEETPNGVEVTFIAPGLYLGNINF